MLATSSAFAETVSIDRMINDSKVPAKRPNMKSNMAKPPLTFIPIF